MKNITIFALLFVLTFSFSFTASAYNFGTTTLKNGSRGEAVMELQRFLNATLNLGLAVDGKLGPKTIVILKKWQNDHGLEADGLIGAKTKLIMNSSTNQASTENKQSSKEEKGACLNTAIKAYVASNTPMSTEVLPGQKNVDMAHYTFEGDGKITQLLFNVNMDTGDGQTNPNSLLISTMRLYDESGKQIGSTVYSNKNMGYIFTGNSLVVLKKNQPLTISLKADISDDIKNRQAISTVLNGCDSNFTDSKTGVNKKGFRIYNPAQVRIGQGNPFTIQGLVPNINVTTGETTYSSPKPTPSR